MRQGFLPVVCDIPTECPRSRHACNFERSQDVVLIRVLACRITGDIKVSIMQHGSARNMVELNTDQSIWERFYSVFPLVIVGTREPDGADDLAPKHLAMPMSWKNHFGFVCSPGHRTYQNIAREKKFGVTYVRPDQAVMASLAASPRCEDGEKPVIDVLPTQEGNRTAMPLLDGGYLFLECELVKFVDDLDENSLIIGRIIAAQVSKDVLRTSDADDQQLVHDAPLLAYLYPGRFAEIVDSRQMPMPAGFKR